MKTPLPPKGQEVSIDEIQGICADYYLYNLWALISEDPPKRPFKSDGCSGGCPDTWGEYNLYPACFIHDLKYWANYPDDEGARLIADAELMVDITKITSNVSLAQIMYAGVRAGGGSFWRKSYSFGFGRIKKKERKEKT